jgi:hypothetical protein
MRRAKLYLTLLCVAFAALALLPASALANYQIVNWVEPTIEGEFLVGHVLTATPGGWDRIGYGPINELTFTYKWLHCPSYYCEAIPGAESSTYTAESSYVGQDIAVAVYAHELGAVEAGEVSESYGPLEKDSSTAIESTGANGEVFVASGGVDNTAHTIQLNAYANADANSATGLLHAFRPTDGRPQTYGVFASNGTTPVTGSILTGDVLAVTAENGSSTQDYVMNVDEAAPLCSEGECERVFATSEDCSEQAFVVPNGVSSLGFTALGGAGGGIAADAEDAEGGPGGSTSGETAVSGGDTLELDVGGGGAGNSGADRATGGCFGGGTVYGGGAEAGAGGGGGSFLFDGNTLIAAGGGGGGAASGAAGGAAGEAGGADPAWLEQLAGGGATSASAGGGGTGSINGAAGTGPASVSQPGRGGNTAVDGSARSGGGGGGGYYGGGSGASETTAAGGGGGGSDYALGFDSFDTVRTDAGVGAQDGDNGRIAIRFARPSDSLALTASSTRVKPGTNAVLTATLSPVPAHDGPGVGTITFTRAAAGNTHVTLCEDVAVNAATGVASCETTSQSAEAFDVTAAYSGSPDTVYAATSSEPLELSFAEPAAEVTPASHDFGEHVLNSTSADETFLVTDTGASDLSISGMVIGGAQSSQFAIDGGTCSTSAPIEPGQTCTIMAHFTPTSTGAKTAEIVLADNAPSSPQSIALSGAGFAEAVPSLLAPVSDTSSTTPLTVTFELPEAAASNTAKVSFLSGASTVAVVTLDGAAESAGLHTVSLDTHALAEGTDIASTSASELPDGTYDIVVSYRNAYGDPEASAAASGVKIVTSTAAPTLSSPASEAQLEGPFSVAYELPEAPAHGSIVLRLAHGAVVYLLTLADAAAGEHTLTINPADPAASTGVILATPSGAIPPGPYELTMSYQDGLANPVAISPARSVTILNAELCQAGSWAPDGEAPCTEATPGHYAASRGATQQTACVEGTYDPVSGSTTSSACLVASPGHEVSESGSSAESECVAGRYQPASGAESCDLATPGSYVSAAGASTEQECVPGDYQSAPGASECLSAPEGHFVAAHGATIAVLCAPGTHDQHTGSTSAAACESDLPGSYSGAGAAVATQCEAGTYVEAPAAIECGPAQPGNWAAGPGASAQTACPAGTHNPHTASVSVAACEVDAPGYHSAAGAAEPSACTPGTYAASAAAPACIEAEPGHYVAGSAASSQTECVAGTYAEHSGATSCVQTPAGYYSDAGAATPTPCPSGTESAAGALSCRVKQIPSAKAEHEQPSEQTGSTQTGAVLPTATLVPTAPVCQITKPDREPRFARTHKLGYMVQCNLSMVLDPRVMLTLSARHTRATVLATPHELSTVAGKPMSGTVAFKLTKTAAHILQAKGLKLTLSVSVYPAADQHAAPAGAAKLRLTLPAKARRSV